MHVEFHLAVVAGAVEVDIGKTEHFQLFDIITFESIYNHFLYYYLSSSQGQHSISGIVSGSAQLKFNKTSFRNMEILIPDEGVVQKFNDFYEPLFNKIIQNRAEVINLSKIRNLLLPNLLNSPKNKF